MEENSVQLQRPAWVSAIYLMLVTTAGFILIGPLVGLIASIPFMDDGLMTFAEKMKTPAGHPEIKTPLLIIQTFATLIGLAAGPALYWWQSGKKNPLIPADGLNVQTILFVVTPFIVITFMPVNSIFIEWNANFVFPEWLRGFERFAKDAEAQNAEMIKLFTKFDNIGQFLFALFTIAILAGFCEELCFRGMLQPLLIKSFGNVHIAIWTTAIIFSAFHLQFFGFVPRMLLGALFGYLYYWSGSLLVAMLGHMINNGVGLISIYLDQKSIVDFDPDSTESVPLPAVIFAAVLFTLLLIYFYRITRKNSKPLPA